MTSQNQFKVTLFLHFYFCRCLGTKQSLWQYWFAVISLGLTIHKGQNAEILTSLVWKCILNTLLVCMWWALGFRVGIVRLETEPNVTETWISELEVSWNSGFVSGSFFVCWEIWLQYCDAKRPVERSRYWSFMWESSWHRTEFNFILCRPGCMRISLSWWQATEEQTVVEATHHKREPKDKGDMWFT